MNKIDIAPAWKGRITNLDLLKSESTIQFTTSLSDLKAGGIIFEVTGPEFSFIFGSNEKGLFVKRNEVFSILTYDDIKEPSVKPMIFLTWSHNKISLYFCSGIKHIKAEAPTEPCSPPSSLIKWARKQNLLPMVEYESEEQLREKVYSCLLSIQDKIDEYGAINPFWDITYFEKKIVSRTPKKETDVQPVISLLLSDQMLMAGIEVIPEYQTGRGDLDFMFMGNVKDNGITKICAEFKNAHSKDLFHGLEDQLPLYMKNCECNYGAYCVLNYKGEWFPKPDKFENKLDMELSIHQSKSTNPLVHNGIRCFIFSLSKKKTASK